MLLGSFVRGPLVARVAPALVAGAVAVALSSACVTSSEVGRFNAPGADAGSGVPVDAREAITLEVARARISASADGACAVTSAGSVRCWGDNRAGTLGNDDDSVAISTTPVSVKGVVGTAGVFGGPVAQCAVPEPDKGSVRCWGDVVYGTFNGFPQTHFVTYSATAVEGLGEVSSLALGLYFQCALTVSGGVKCWGLGGVGQLGSGGIEDQVVPADVRGLELPAISVAASQGGFFACAALTDGTVWCWGENDRGQLGTGALQSSRVPVRTAPLPAPARVVAAGRAHACALLEDKTVACWGAADEGQLGASGADKLLPVLVAGIDDARTIAAGARQTCVLHESGKVSCFGNGRPIASEVSGGALEIAVGVAHGCALLDGDRVACWGENDRGQLGGFDGGGKKL